MADRRVRPVDAAGLVLLRDGPAGPEVLLGRRHRRVAFLPDIYVFPGGRVDPADARPSGFAEAIAPELTARLRTGARRRPPEAFLRAALRETLEETGLLLGQPLAAGAPAPPPVSAPATGRGVPGRNRASRPTGDPWRVFAAAGLAPAFDALDFVCRAITPASSPRRYDTRFFLADGAAARGTLGGSGELEDLRWFTIPETARLGLVDVTQVVLAEALRRWRHAGLAGSPAPLLSYRGDVVCLHRPGAGRLRGEAAVLGATPPDRAAARRAGRA